MEEICCFLNYQRPGEIPALSDGTPDQYMSIKIKINIKLLLNQYYFDVHTYGTNIPSVTDHVQEERKERKKTLTETFGPAE